MKISIKLTVFFEDPFWVGVFERTIEDQYQVFKFTFGAEPRDCEIYDFILAEYNYAEYSTPIQADSHEEKHVNPKRLQKKISRELENVRTGTKAQNAIKLQHEENKAEHKRILKQKKELTEKRKFELRQIKKKEKQRGH